MTNSYIDTRELRTFRFKYYTAEIHSTLKNKSTITGICVTDSFNPNDRREWQKNPINKELSIKAIPNQIGRFLFQDKNKAWANVHHLLQGQIFFFKNKVNKKLSLDLLVQFLSVKKFSLRLLFYKDQLYRANFLNSYNLSITTDHNTRINFLKLLKYQLIRVIYLNMIPSVSILK